MKIKSGSNLSKVRKDNYASILGTIYQQGPIMRSEVAKQLGVTLPTVTTTIKQLLEDGVLREEPVLSASGSMGRKASAVDFVKEAGYALGIEWSAVGIIGCITDLRGNLIEKTKRILEPEKNSYGEMLLKTRECVDSLIKRAKADKVPIIGAGWATPGMVEPEKGILVCSSMDHVTWQNEQIQKDLSDLLEMPVCIENHVRVRAIGQDMFEREERPDVYLYYFAQMGISCCIMSDGGPFGKGKHGTGDIGHTIMDLDGSACDCGKKGCLQAFIGEQQLIRKAKELLQAGRAEILRKVCGDPKNPEIVELALAIDCGDEELLESILPAVQYMGISIANIVNLLNSELVVVDCALMNSQVLKKYLRKMVLENNMFKNELDLKIDFIQANRYTGARGACGMAIERFLIGNP